MNKKVIVVSFLNDPTKYHIEIRIGEDPINYICNGPTEGSQDYEDICADLEQDSQTLILAWIEDNT